MSKAQQWREDMLAPTLEVGAGTSIEVIEGVETGSRPFGFAQALRPIVHPGDGWDEYAHALAHNEEE